MRLQAATRQYGWSYSRFIHAQQQHNITLNRKVLSELAATEPFAFKSVIDVMNHEQQNRPKQEA
jgi:large subunit ribosomal protein L20